MDFWRMVSQRFSRLSSLEPDRQDYELLPSTQLPTPLSSRHCRLPSRFKTLRYFTLRRLAFLTGLVSVFLLLGVLWSGIPPNYDDIRQYERLLPQHNLTKATVEGAKYLRFPGHLWGHGFNNILQETILMSYLAFVSNRSFVFEDYVWSESPLPYTIYDFALRPTRIPLNAFISGPAAGGPMSGPRAVSARFWESACPLEKRQVISSASAPNRIEGSAMIQWWVEQLNNVQAHCVEIDSSKQTVFDFSLFGSPRILSLWDGLTVSPILTDYTWSLLVQSAVTRNFVVLQPTSPKLLLDISTNLTLHGLVAVHLRRGDYSRHCTRLARWGLPYTGINQFHSLADRFTPPLTPEKGDHGEIEAYYMRHCLPEVAQIVERLRTVREEHLGLKRLYVLSNGWGWWLNGLEKALLDDGWESMVSSLDLQLDAEQYYVSMAVDMAIAEKAEVFVGNGFSSLTSNIVMLRIAKGLDVASNRFL